MPTAGERRGKIAVGDKVVVLGMPPKHQLEDASSLDWVMVFALRRGQGRGAFRNSPTCAAIDRAYLQERTPAQVCPNVRRRRPNMSPSCKDAHQAFGPLPLFRREAADCLSRRSPSLTDGGGVVLPLGWMADDFRLATNDIPNAPVTLRGNHLQNSSTVDSGSTRIATAYRANVGTGEDTGRPAAEVVALHRLPKVDADLRALGNLFE